MANVKLVIDRRAPLKDGSYPIVFCISCNGSTRNFPSGFHIQEILWNEKECSVKKNYPSYESINNRLREMEIDIRTKMIECTKIYSSTITAQRIKDYILEKPIEETTVYSFWKDEIDLMQQSGRNGGARIYMDSLSAIGKIHNLFISFNKVDYSWLKKLEAQLGKKNIGVNSIRIYLRTFRAVYNKAINAKVVTYDNYPFRGFRIRKEQTSPQAISFEEIRAFFNLNIKQGEHLYDSWMMGKLMFLLIGINFKDMLLLKEKNIQHGRIVYARAKTGKHYSVKILQHASDIIDYFKLQNTFTIIGKIGEEDFTDTLRFPLIVIKNTEQLKLAMENLYYDYDVTRHVKQMKSMQEFELSEKEFAQIIGRSRMYRHLSEKAKPEIPSLLLGDQQMGAVVQSFYHDEDFGNLNGGNIPLWNFYNLLTGANKSTYIDGFLERSVNAGDFAYGITEHKKKTKSFWYMG
jgi:integrase/recombinase XerD